LAKSLKNAILAYIRKFLAMQQALGTLFAIYMAQKRVETIDGSFSLVFCLSSFV